MFVEAGYAPGKVYFECVTVAVAKHNTFHIHLTRTLVLSALAG
jgi:hypothetical protein